MIPFGLMRPVLHALDPETAHNLTIRALKSGLGPRVRPDRHAALRTTVCGLDFPNPLGLAAGFDKNGEVPDALLRAGMGFAECGTVTPLAQAGNSKPRIFRLTEDRAVVNRLGFNNRGLEFAASRLEARTGRPGIVGANIGVNKDSNDQIADYVTGLDRLYGLADYFTVNISSPNTPGLRDLQGKSALERLLNRLLEIREGKIAGGIERKPILLKIAPDLDGGDKQDIADVVVARPLDGLIVSNTTITRPETLHSAHAGEQGGLSGAPLMALSTAVLADMYRLTGGKLALVGAGGVASGADAYAKIRAGASLVQLYSALVCQGPGLIPIVQDELARLLARDGYASVADAVGADHAA